MPGALPVYAVLASTFFLFVDVLHSEIYELQVYNYSPIVSAHCVLWINTSMKTQSESDDKHLMKTQPSMNWNYNDNE